MCSVIVVLKLLAIEKNRTPNIIKKAPIPTDVESPASPKASKTTDMIMAITRHNENVEIFVRFPFAFMIASLS